VLRGFQLTFGNAASNIDHQIDEIGVWEERGQLHVDFNDKNDDDKFSYRVKYAYVPSELFARSLRLSGATRNEEVKTIPRGPAVLSGFRFDYASGDHELLTFKVEVRPGNMQVGYSDDNADDPFRWKVKVAILKDVITTTPQEKSNPTKVTSPAQITKFSAGSLTTGRR
jgi:hypothetical protein